MTLLGASVVVLWIVTAITVLAVVGLVRQNKVLEAHVRRLSSPSVTAARRDQPTPEQIRELADGADSLVAIYVDAQCPSCDSILAAAPKLAAELNTQVKMAVVPLSGELEMPGANLIVAAKSSPLRTVDVPATPYAVVWSGQGTFRTAAPIGSEAATRELFHSLMEGTDA